MVINPAQKLWRFVGRAGVAGAAGCHTAGAVGAVGAAGAMDPAWLERGIDLGAILYDQATQYSVIRLGMVDLREGDAVPRRDWLGNPPPEPTAAKRRKPVGNTLPDILSRADDEDGDGDGPGAGAEAGGGDALSFAPIVDAAEAMIQDSAATPHCSTWFVLFFLLMSDSLRGIVLRGTPPHIAGPYFEDFDNRVSGHICGRIAYSSKETAEKRSKSGRVLQSAVSPVEAVAAEWSYFEAIVRAARTAEAGSALI